MLKTVAMTLLVAGGIQSAVGQSADNMPAESDQPSLVGGPSQQQAVELATKTLAGQLGIAATELKVQAVEPRTWSDSSMGCGKPGSMAMDVITEGYAVTLMAADRKYQVHVSGSNAAVCNRPTLTRKDISQPANARGLDVMAQKARQDLAQRLGIDQSQVRLYGTQPHQWADNGLDCPRAGEVIVAKPVNGFKLSFKVQGRIYTYHSDMQDVRACPAIESL